MNIAILIVLSFILCTASAAYLSVKETEGETAPDKLKETLKKNRRLIIALTLAAFLMSGLSVSLECIYDNTLIENMKRITLIGMLVTVSVTDMREQIIPNKVILAGIFVRVCYAIAELVTLGSGYFDILRSDAISVSLALVLFLLGVLVMKNGIGMGDVKLVFVMGLYQGVLGVVSSLFCSLVVSFFVAIFMLITRKKSRKDAIAFAPSVLVGTAVSVFMTGM